MIKISTEFFSNVEVDSLIFPGGEVNVNLFSTLKNVKSNHVTITAHLSSSDEIMKLLLVNDALKRLGITTRHLKMPYVPYARQDRVCNQGEAHSLKVFANLINSCEFKSVTVFDPHSDVTEALINNIIIKSNHEFVDNALSNLKLYKSSFYLISPDAGASKKIQALAKYLYDLKANDRYNLVNYDFEIIQCGKVRDTATGKLTGFTVGANDLQNKPCVIVDDICSRGGTFLGLAAELKAKNAGDISLVVSHYENVADQEAFKKAGINKIICTDSLKPADRSELLIQLSW